MSYRYTNKDIQSALTALNVRAGFAPGTNLWSQVDGRQVCQVGYYHTWADGYGVKLVKTTNDRGGHRSMFKEYPKTKRELYNMIWSFIHGLDEGGNAHAG